MNMRDINVGNVRLSVIHRRADAGLLRPLILAENKFLEGLRVHAAPWKLNGLLNQVDQAAAAVVSDEEQKHSQLTDWLKSMKYQGSYVTQTPPEDRKKERVG